jgi:hypothetical protein
MKSFCIKLNRSDNSCCAKIKPEKFSSILWFKSPGGLHFQSFRRQYHQVSTTYMVLHIYASFLHYASSPFPFSPPLQKGKSKEEDSWVHQGIFRLSMDSRDCHTNHFNHENVGWRLKCQVWKNWTLYRKLMFLIRSSAQKISYASDVGYLAPVTLSPRKRPNQFNFRLFSYEPVTS